MSFLSTSGRGLRGWIVLSAMLVLALGIGSIGLVQVAPVCFIGREKPE